MKLIKVRTEDVEYIEDIMCDICGNSCKDKMKINWEFLSLRADWGYGSEKDGEIWQCDICEACANKLKNYIEKLGGKIQVSSYE